MIIVVVVVEKEFKIMKYNKMNEIIIYNTILSLLCLFTTMIITPYGHSITDGKKTS